MEEWGGLPFVLFSCAAEKSEFVALCTCVVPADYVDSRGLKVFCFAFDG